MFSKGSESLLFIILLLQLQTTIAAKNYGNIKEAFEHGHPSLQFRIRQEAATQDYVKDAHATTLQSKVGYRSGAYVDSYLLVEAINVASFFGQRYNPAVTPLTKADYAIITDPKGTGISNMHINIGRAPHTDIIIGRQYITLDNERMVGANSFRQYPTSFDGITIKNDFFKDFEISYSFVNYINTCKNNIFNIDGRRKLSTHLFNVLWKNFMYGHITAYTYMNHDLSISTNSQNTIGIRGIADENFRHQFDFGYTLELAYQNTQTNNPQQYSTLYLAMGADKHIMEICDAWLLTGKLGYEFIGGHNGGAPGRTFKFPLGTSYGFNGLAEGYNIIPDGGLMDYYAALELDHLEVFKTTLGIHIFQFAKGSGQQLAGKEIDFDLSYKFNKNLNMLLRYAQLTAQNNSTVSTKRISAQLSYIMH